MVPGHSMNAARRNARRRGWPRGLYEPRPGYYVWREPGRKGEPGKTHVIGEVPFAVAKNEAIAANTHIAEQRPNLVARLMGAANTVADALKLMPVSPKPKTAAQHRYYDKIISAAIGQHTCAGVTVKDAADLLEPLTPTVRNLVRSRLRQVFRKAMAKGWCDHNPAEPTETVRVVVKRGRLTLDAFRAVREQCEPWMQRAMDVALVLGCDVSTLASLHRRMVSDGALTYSRGKTGVAIRVPLRLRLDVAGLCLADLVPRRIGKFVHDPDPHGNAADDVPASRISAAFTTARRAAGIPDERAPTFHEIRSLAKRLYVAQGNVDTLALLGHKDEGTGQLYANPRGVAPMDVRIA
jgi:hypothetical protein